MRSNMSIKENKALVRRVVEFANRRDLPAFWKPFTPESVIHDARGDKSSKQLKQQVSMVFTAFPDFHWTIEDMIAEEDKVFFRTTFRGTHKGDLDDIASTGRKVDVTVMQIARIVSGRAVEFWHYPDELGLRQQLGAVL
jgi:predicted ester cyclase